MGECWTPGALLDLSLLSLLLRLRSGQALKREGRHAWRGKSGSPEGAAPLAGVLGVSPRFNEVAQDWGI